MGLSNDVLIRLSPRIFYRNYTQVFMVEIFQLGPPHVRYAI
jgi:hypothetical protein